MYFDIIDNPLLCLIYTLIFIIHLNAQIADLQWFDLIFFFKHSDRFTRVQLSESRSVYLPIYYLFTHLTGKLSICIFIYL